ncbi:MAG: CPBP family intramembrane metalloprotease [Lachnospiraceae bacterium]|nr:CPBP family intramembrane metalloprotease [Lachnospiraceae bacterium]
MKMSLWKTMGVRWEKEELQKWSSLKKTAYLLLPLLVYFIVHDIAEVLLLFPLNMLFTTGGERICQFFSQYSDTIQGIVYGGASLIGVAAILSIVKGEIIVSAAYENGDEEKRWLDEKKIRAYGFLAAFAFYIATGINILVCLTGLTGSSEAYNKVHEMQYGVQFAVGLVLYGIISPLAEEAVFRGVLYNRMKRCFNYKIAILVSSLLFGIYHGNLVQAVYGSILGLMIAYFYDQYQSFAAPVLFHAVANVSMYVMNYQFGYDGMNRNEALPITLLVGIACIAVAGGIFFYIKRKCLDKVIRE